MAAKLPQDDLPQDPLPDDDRVEIIDHQTPYRGHFRIEAFHLRHRKHDGGWTDPLRRELFCRGPTAAVLPYDPRRDEVVLIEQFRMGAYRAGIESWLLEPVAGVLDDGEGPEATVRREALEEAGCRVSDLEEVGHFIPSPGGCSETTTIYVGRCDARGLGGIHGLDAESEDIKVHVLSFDAAWGLLEAGRIPCVYAVIPLQWLALNREALRRRWV